MLAKLKDKLKRYIYSKLLHKVILINKESYTTIKHLREFKTISVSRNGSIFKFRFLEDRRKNRRSKYKSVYDSYVQVFIVEILIPDEASSYFAELNNKLVMVIKLMLVDIDYELISELLLESCINIAEIKKMKVSQA